MCRAPEGGIPFLPKEKSPEVVYKDLIEKVNHFTHTVKVVVYGVVWGRGYGFLQQQWAI